MGKGAAIAAVSGVKNSGKTALIAAMLPHLTAAGLRVAVIKHDGHRFLPEPLDTDTAGFWPLGPGARPSSTGRSTRWCGGRLWTRPP